MRQHPRSPHASRAVYRLATFVATTDSTVQLLLGMLVLVPCATRLELQLGTVLFALTLAVVQAVLAAVLCAYSVLATFALGHSEVFYKPGFSGPGGLALALLVQYAINFATAESIKLPRMAPLPFALVPVVTLCVLALLPGAQVAHLFLGVLCGYMCAGGLLRPVLPSKSTAAWLHTHWLVAPLTQRNGFIPLDGTAPEQQLPLTMVSVPDLAAQDESVSP